MNLTEILNTKKYVRQGSPALSVAEYIEPVIDNMLKYCNESDVVIKYSHPQENANEDNSINTSYARVLIQAKIPGYDILDSGATVGLVYALDKQVPEFTTYAGHEVFACTNLCISADEDVTVTRDNHKAAQVKISDYLEGIEKKKEEFIQFHNKLQNKELSLEDLETTIGHVLRQTLTKYKSIGSTAVTYGFKQLLDSKSSYGIKNNSTDLWNVYNSITDSYSNKFKSGTGLAERPIKTRSLSTLFRELV